MAESAQAVEEKENDAEQSDAKTQAQEAQFPEAGDTQSTGTGGSIDILLDMTVAVTVTIGQTQMPIRRLLQLGPGSVVKLNKPIDAPADLYLKDTKFATGNIVVVDGQFAVRIRQLMGLGNAGPEQNEE